jgi:diguanylate cyclase (GGDEF)-like protein
MQLNSDANHRIRAASHFAANSDRNPGWLLWAMGATLVAFIVAMLSPGAGSLAARGTLQLLVTWFPAVVCMVAVVRTRFKRPENILATAALTASAFGFTWYGLAFLQTGQAPKFPYLADAAVLLFYPLMLVALMVLVRRKLPGLARSVLLDSAVGALGAAALLAVILSPVIDSLLTGPANSSAVIAYLCPFFDMLIVASIAGMAALHGMNFGRRWWMFALGLVVFTAADTIYALQLSAGTFVVGTPLDAVWATAHALIAFWVAGTALPERETNTPRISLSALAVPLVATAVGIAILILSSQVTVSQLAVVLAGATLVMATIPLAFRQLLLLRQATTDELTGLPNRRALIADMPTRLSAGTHRSAVLMLDLDRFKVVNDTLGHENGDELLIQVAQRLRSQLREGDLLARLGGDEFAVHLRDCDHAEAVTVAVALKSAISEPFDLHGNTVECGIAVGIAMFPEQGRELTVLLRKADLAMYAAKAAAGGRRRETIRKDAHGGCGFPTLPELRSALILGQLILHYRPKVDLATDAVCGVEALVRWKHPALGLLPPGAFLGLAEENGLMRDLTQAVLETALDQAAVWSAQGRDLPVTVTMAPSALFDADLPGRLAGLLDARGLDPAVLLLEVTADAVMADVDRSRAVLTGLRSRGIRISIDQFETAHTSLAQLLTLPVDELKLDLSLVVPMERTQPTATIAPTLTLAHSLDVGVATAGLDHLRSYAELVRYGRDHSQGFYLSDPVPAAELEDRLVQAGLVPLAR